VIRRRLAASLIGRAVTGRHDDTVAALSSPAPGRQGAHSI
jgi:hypothetical protein